MPVHPIGEVLAGDADHTTLPALELSVIDVIPFLHDHKSGTYALLSVVRLWQGKKA